jgi:pyruvate/2-oxoglutarate/acetoin dehydrogenase E1 component
LIIEEGNLTLGWGAEIAARSAESLGPRLQTLRRVAAADSPIPASLPMENALLPGVEQIIQMAKKMV